MWLPRLQGGGLGAAGHEVHREGDAMLVPLYPNPPEQPLVKFIGDDGLAMVIFLVRPGGRRALQAIDSERPAGCGEKGTVFVNRQVRRSRGRRRQERRRQERRRRSKRRRRRRMVWRRRARRKKGGGIGEDIPDGKQSRRETVTALPSF